MAYPRQTSYGNHNHGNASPRQQMSLPQGYGRSPYGPGRPQHDRGYEQDQGYGYNGQSSAPQYPRQQQYQELYSSGGYQDQRYADKYQEEGEWQHQGQEQYGYNAHGNGYEGQEDYEQHTSEAYGYQKPAHNNSGHPEHQQHGTYDYAEPPKTWAKQQRSFSSGDVQGVERQVAKMSLNGQGYSSNGMQQHGRPQQPMDNLAVPKRHARERILTSPESPKNRAWDNPFPSFPAMEEKKKAAKADSQRTSTATSSSGRSRESGRSFETQRSGGRSPARDPRRDDISARSSGLTSIDESGSPQHSRPYNGRPPQNGSQWPMQPRPGSDQRAQHPDQPRMGPPARSFTMPNQAPQGGSMEMARHGEANGNYGAQESPSNRSVSQGQLAINPMTGQRHQHMRSSPSEATDMPFGRPTGRAASATPGSQSRQRSMDDESGPVDARSAWASYSPASRAHSQPIEEEEDMPNFDAVASKNNKTSAAALDKELHMGSKQDERRPPTASGSQERGRQQGPNYWQEHPGPNSRSRSQPNVRRGGAHSEDNYYGFDFGEGVSHDPMPQQQRYDQPGDHFNQDPNSSRYGTQSAQNIRQRNMGPPTGPPGRPADYRPPPAERSFNPPPLNVSRALASSSARSSPMPSPVDRRTPVSATSRNMKPESLSHNPLPAASRSVLQKPQTPVGGAGRPPPVRMYDAAQQGPQIAPPTPAPGADGNQPVTHEELQRLRTTVNARPNDQSTQLLLARKLVDAAAQLADDQGRADAKTRQKNRERYTNEAHRLVKKLVAHGNAEAMFFLADAQAALGVPKDSKEAFGLYQNAAKQDHAQAAYRVAVCCELGPDNGGGTRRDPLKAVQWYQRAAALGDVPAMYKLGMIQLKGLLGQPRDARAALPWLERAAQRADGENPHALHSLGLLYAGEDANGAGVVAADPPRAVGCFRRAAELGYKFAQCKLGDAFEHGHLGCPLDAHESVRWYSRAAAQGEHQSELAVSGFYLTGAEGVVAQSDTEAYLWARKAAEAGLAKAEYAMGYYTEVGIGVDANLEAAKRWYWKAASQNFPKAKERLEDLRRGGSRMQKSRVSRTTVQKSEGDCVLM